MLPGMLHGLGRRQTGSSFCAQSNDMIFVDVYSTAFLLTPFLGPVKGSSYFRLTMAIAQQKIRCLITAKPSSDART